MERQRILRPNGTRGGVAQEGLPLLLLLVVLLVLAQDILGC
jgi:hypothetical protein